MKKLLAALLLITGCNSKVQTNDSTQNVVQSGESYAYVVVRLEFIEQMKSLCQDLILAENYTTEALYNQAVAQCTFDKLASLSVNPDQIGSFVNTYCLATSDRSGLTPEELVNVTAACSALGYPI